MSQTAKAPRRILDPEVRRRQILAAARDLLVEQGYQNIRLDEVATRTGISKGALYLYFHDKEQLFGAVFNEAADQIEGRLADLQRATGLGPLERLRQVLQAEMAFFDDHRDMVMQLSVVHPHLLCGRKHGNVVRKRFQSHLHSLADRIQDCVPGGTFRPHETLTGGLLAASLVRMFMLRKRMRGDTEPLETRVDELMDLLVRGLGPASSGVPA